MTVTYPFAPLEAMLADPLAEHNDGPVKIVARQLHIGTQQIYRYRRTGMTTELADRLAIAAGLHPSVVWDTWFIDAASEACPLCMEPLTGRRLLCASCHHEVVAWEHAHDRIRQREWWARLDRYRETVCPEGHKGAA